MRTKKLYTLHIFGKNQDKKNIVAALQHLGVVHISKADGTSEHFKTDTSLEGVEDISLLLLQLHYIQEQTQRKKKFLLEALPPLAKTMRDAKAFIGKHIKKIEKLVAQEKALIEEEAEKHLQLQTLGKLPQKITLPKSKRFRTLVYTSDKDQDFSTIKTQGIVHIKADKRHFYIVTIDAAQVQSLQEAVRGTQLKHIDLSFVQGDTISHTHTLHHEIRELKKKQHDIRKEIHHTVTGKEHELFVLTSTLENYYEQHTISSHFQRSKNFFLLKGYCEPHIINKIKNALPQTTIHVSPAAEDAPTKLSNNLVTKPFQIITEMFSMPTYGSVDPTPLVAFFFPFFFGFMLSDIGYGLVLLLVLLGLQLKYGRSMIQATKIFSIAAVSSILFGLIFGSFFGNLIRITPLYQDSFSASFNILQISLVIGLIHINLGVLLKVYQMIIKKKSLERMISEAAPIPLIELTSVLLIFQQPVAALITGIILVAILIREKSIFGLMDITGFFGTWFSYARLLALSLATAGVAFAINIIAEKALGFGAIGWVLWILIIVGGHTFNFVLNALGCTIHSARLHYVEFFSIFFEGGGNKFKPFKINNGG